MYNIYQGLVQQEQAKYQQGFDEIRCYDNNTYSITDPNTGKELEYCHLRIDQKTQPTWNITCENKFGMLLQALTLVQKVVREYKEPTPCSSSTKRTIHQIV